MWASKVLSQSSKSFRINTDSRFDYASPYTNVDPKFLEFLEKEMVKYKEKNKVLEDPKSQQ